MTPGASYRAPTFHAAGAFAAALALYVATLAPTTWFWDTSEYIASAHILGIPHPPGNPLFVLVGHVWSALLSPTGLSVAVRINLLAAACSALATGVLFLVTHRVLTGWMTSSEGAPLVEAAPDDGAFRAERLLPLAGAWSGSLLAATAYTVWNQSNVNEKVYPVSLLTIALVSLLALRWVDAKDRPGSEWLLVMAVYVMAIGSTNHLMSVLPAPALAMLVLVERPRALLSRTLVSQGAVAVLVGLSVNLFLPIRAAERPIISEGEPVCASITEAAAAVYSMGRTGCPALASTLTREQYGDWGILSDKTTDMFDPGARTASLFAHQLLNYFQYFDWQWARGLAASELPGNARLPFSLAFLGLGVLGLVVASRSRRGHAAYLAVLAATLTVGLVVYLNFQYGYSLGAPGPFTEVRERDYFFIASFHLWGFLAGMGLMAAWRWAAGGLHRRGLALASPVLVLAFVPLVFNWSWANRAGDYAARDFALDMLQSVEPYGVLFTGGDNDTFPLWYLQEVEGIRQDVTVVIGEYLNTDWYPRQLKHHTGPERQRPFREDAESSPYEAPPAAPTRPVTTLPDELLAAAGYAVLAEPLGVRLGETVVEYPAGYSMTRGDQIALAIIRDSIGERPIHFANTGAAARNLGLEEWSVTQGLAGKLRLPGMQDEAGVYRLLPEQGGGRIDLARSLRLARDVFQYRGLRDRPIWADMASANIPSALYVLHVQLAAAAEQAGESPELVERLIVDADAFLRTALGGARAMRYEPAEAME